MMRTWMTDYPFLVALLFSMNLLFSAHLFL